MSGTSAGGKRAAQTIKAKHGADFYKIQGAKGGKLGTTGGFFANRELAKIAGAKGGRISKRTKKVIASAPFGQVITGATTFSRPTEMPIPPKKSWWRIWTR